MLRLADYLGAPENILSALANILWDDLQDKETDSEEAKDEKKALRDIAKAYNLCLCPGDFLCLKPNIKLLEKINGVYYLNLSYDNLKKYDCSFKFTSLGGIKKFLKDLPANSKVSIDVSNHNIKYFETDEICDDKQYSYEIDLSNNQIDSYDLNPNLMHRTKKLNLQNNKITSLDDDFFNIIRNMRTQGRNITIDLRNNLISEEQKKEIRRKWNLAINTLPERIYNTSRTLAEKVRPGLIIGAPIAATLFAGYHGYSWSVKTPKWFAYPYTALVSCAGLFSGSLISTLLSNNYLNGHEPASFATGLMASYLVANYFSHSTLANSNKVLSLPAAAPIGMILGVAAYYQTKKLLTYQVAPLLAKLTHPQIGWRDSSRVWQNQASKPEILL